MTDPRDWTELVELMGRYTDVSDGDGWDDLAESVFADRLTCDFTSLGSPLMTVSRDEWCAAGSRSFTGWTATHHAITGHRIEVDGDTAKIRAHVRAEHWAPPEAAAGGPDCWLVVGTYDNVAIRTSAGWRLSTIRLTATHQENPHLPAAVAAASS